MTDTADSTTTRIVNDDGHWGRLTIDREPVAAALQRAVEALSEAGRLAGFQSSQTGTWVHSPWSAVIGGLADAVEGVLSQMVEEPASFVETMCNCGFRGEPHARWLHNADGGGD